MDLPTYTNIWRIEKRLYKLYDFRLPMPLPVGTFGVAMGVFLIWVVLLSILNAPFDFGNGWHLVLWVVPPGVITVLATRPVIEGKRLTELLISQARFFTEPRVMTRLAPEYEPGEVRVSVRVWHRHPDAGPLPLPRRQRAEGEHGAAHGADGEGAEHAERDGDALGEGADVVVPDAPPLRGVAGRAQADPVHAEPWEELYTPAEGADAAEAEHAADVRAEGSASDVGSMERGRPFGDDAAVEQAEHAESAGRTGAAETAGPAEPTPRAGLRSRGADGAVGRPHTPETVHGAAATAGAHEAHDHEHELPRATETQPSEPTASTGSTDSSWSPEPSGTSEAPSGSADSSRARARERVPAYAAAGTARQTAGDQEQPSAVHDEYQEAETESRSSTHTSVDPEPSGDRRSVGRKVLNYFGFALEPGPDDPSGGDGGQGSGRGRGSGRGDGSEGFEEDDACSDRAEDEDEARGRRSRQVRKDRRIGQEGVDEQDGFDGFDDPVYVTEEDEDHDRDAWFASLRASSGHTPVGLTSKGAYTGSDTGPMSSEELAEAAGAREESAPARRLRGRVQGIQVARELDGRRSESERLEADAPAPEREQERRPETARGRAPERAPERRRARAQGQGMPSEAPEDSEARGTARAAGTAGAPAPAETQRAGAQARPAQADDARAAGAAGTAMPDASEQDSGAGQASGAGQVSPAGRRPHAAPWELDRDRQAGQGRKARRDAPEGVDGLAHGGLSDLSDYAARFAEATGRPAVETHQAPWLPPASGAPTESGEAPEPAQPPEAERVYRAVEPAPERGERAPRTDEPASAGESASSGNATSPSRGAAAVDESRAGSEPDTSVEASVDMSVHPSEEASADNAASSFAGNAAGSPVGTSADTSADTSAGTSGDTGTTVDGAATDAGSPAEPGAAADTRAETDAGPEAAAKPRLELDHGTGEHDAMPLREHEDPDAHGPEWNEHMSVLDRHLSKADTPAPPRPKFADVVPGDERGPDQSGTAAWFDDGGRHHPDQPQAGDRGNPVISGRELRERNRREQEGSGHVGPDQDVLDSAGGRQGRSGTADSADTDRTLGTADGTDAGTTDTDSTVGTTEPGEPNADDTTDAGTSAPKPPTQLDHGTGELASFAEVRGERAASAASASTAPGSAPASDPDAPHRRTADEFERAEAQALEERRRRAARERSAGGTDPATEAGPGTGTDAGTAQGRDTGPEQPSGGGHTSGASHVPAESDASHTPGASGQPARSVVPGTDPDPESGSDPSGPSDPDTTGPDAAEHTGNRSAPASHPRANPSLAALARDHGPDEYRNAPAHPGSGSEPVVSDAAGTDTAHGTEATGAPSDRAPGPDTTDSVHDEPRSNTHSDHQDEITDDAHDGVFHRVANNARRLGRLFGQPVPGEEPDAATERDGKPELELDHGTGEQERLGDTPNGVPAQRPERDDRPEADRADGADRADRPESGGTRGWRRLARVVTGGASPVRSDLPPSDIERLRTPLAGPRNLVVLGCTGGAGQTVTALMIGHTLAAHRDDRVVAVDVNPGPNGLSRRVGAQTPETLTALLANADGVQDYEQMRSYVSRASTGLEVVQTLDDPYVQTLDDRDYGQLAALLGGFYGLALMDPAATGVSRALPGADGLVLVAPASADAERAVSMTFEWLDGNGYSALRANSVLVVNGVSKRSLPDVDAAERVARGRCRAIVRVPWDDHLGASYTRIDVGALRSATKRAHGALGGVLVRGLTD